MYLIRNLAPEGFCFATGYGYGCGGSGGQESNFVDFLAHNGKSERYSYGDSGIVFV